MKKPVRDRKEPEWEYAGASSYPSLWRQTDAGKLAEKKREDERTARRFEEGNKSWQRRLGNVLGMVLMLAWGTFWVGWFAWEFLKIYLKQGL